MKTTNSSSVTASDCCKMLSDALDEGFVIFQNKSKEKMVMGDESTDIQQNATTAFVSVFSSSQHDRNTYIEMIRSSDFQQRHARRLFSALHAVLKITFECEHYVPLSAFEEVDEYESFESEHIDKGKQSISTKDSGSNRNNDDGAGKKRNSNISQFSNCSIVPDLASTEALRFIKYSAMIVQAYLTNQMQRRKSTNSSSEKIFDMIEEVFVVAELLHNNLFALNSCGKEGVMAQKEIVAMCELYWNGRFTDNEVLVTQLIPLLVVKSLNGDATKADIKRLWNMRESLQLLDFQEQDTISELRNLLLKTVSSPLYLKNAEGRKMIAFLFQLHTSILHDFHHSIRPQIGFSNSSILEAYGEIYFTAWKGIMESKEVNVNEDYLSRDGSHEDGESGDADSLQNVIEECLQDFMYASMHVSSPHMTKAIQTLLDPLHAQKKDPEVDALLYRLYNPILWRALSATNPLVRINACTLLHQTFPLHDPNLGNAHLKQVNEKSIEVLLSLLHDDDPKVRVAGCKSSIQILGVFWDALCSAHIRSLLNAIVMKHANDASSSKVRCQAVKGITILLDAKSSHGVLRPLLPILGNRLHDSVERVRLETARMLLKLKGMKGFKYYHVVPSSHILARLSSEGLDSRKSCGPVASAITELLVNSYFPKGEMGSEQTRRTLHFIKQNRPASKVFYANVAKHLEINFCCKLIAMLFKTIKKAVENEERTNASIDHDKTKESNETQVMASNVDLMAGVSEIIYIVYHSISEDLLVEENKECLSYVENNMNDVEIFQVCTYFEDKVTTASTESEEGCHIICSSLLSCVTFSSSKNFSRVCKVLENRVQGSGSIHLIPYFSILFSWGKCDDVVITFTKVLESFFEDIYDRKIDETNSSCVQAAKKRKRTQKGNKAISGIPLIPHQSVLCIIDKVISGRSTNCIQIRDALLMSETAYNALETLLTKVNATIQRILNGGDWKTHNDKDTEIILHIWEVLCKVILHAEARKDHEVTFVSNIKDHLMRMSEFVISTLLELDENIITNSPFQDLNLSRISAIGPRSSVIKLPVTPLPLSPHHKESTSFSPSNGTDSSFLDMEKRGSSEFKIRTDLSSSVRISALCVSLLRSIVSLFDEIILLGLVDCSQIIKFGGKISQVMKKKTCTDVIASLFPSFCRFVILTGKASCNYELMVDVITIFDDLRDQTVGQDILVKSVQSILSYKDKDALKYIQSLISILIEYIPSLIAKMKARDSSYGEIENGGTGWHVVLEAVVNHEKYIPCLIKTLLQSSNLVPGDDVHGKVIQEILLLSSRKCTGKVETEVKEILSKYLNQRTGGVNTMRDRKLEVMIDAILA